ncbi:MAG: sulfurtransferase [Alcaligenaceae bacterium]|nr:sulfurtransferase [Alcaligenaceae bacterium SAGV5]MPS53886.1 sulfurtransferase [Alcaligenaceae bacterium SAGV3]MPT59120.1 sulfurtransferase [Alcaligenaceae bacterium]
MSAVLPASHTVFPFISADALAAALASGGVAVVYVAPDGGPLPAEPIPGSIGTALPAHYADPGDPARGRLPLPSPEAVRRWTAEADLDPDGDIVVYDAANGSAAARAWWVLTWAGLPRVRILDGGLGAWAARSGGAAPPPAQTAVPELAAIDTEAIAADFSAYRLFDARAAAAYAGDGKQPAHLPGAVSSPAGIWQDADGRLLPFAQREALARKLGLFDDDGRPVVAYCGSGVAAAYWIAAVQDLGVKAALYAGSWSAWSSDPARVAAAAPA